MLLILQAQAQQLVEHKQQELAAMKAALAAQHMNWPLLASACCRATEAASTYASSSAGPFPAAREHEQQELMSAETTLVARQALARPVASACCAIRGVSTSASSCSLCCTSC